MSKKYNFNSSPSQLPGPYQPGNAGFTLIELLVVISIIGLLASVVLVALNSARAKARDTKRLADMAQIQKALGLYYDQNNQYPDPEADAGCGGWDMSSVDANGDGNKFIDGLVTAKIITKLPGDPLASGGICFGKSAGYEYRYYRYSVGSYGCDATRGAFLVLGITDMENSNGTYPGSPGWNCPSRNWQDEFEWVTGGFEK